MELNEDIDDIFKRLNEESSFDEPWEGAWEKMEIKLDKGYKKYPAGLSTLKKFGIGVGILSSIIVGIIIFNQITHTNNQYKNSNSELAPDKNELKNIENQKIDLKLNEEDKNAEEVTGDSNKYLSKSNKPKKTTTNITIIPIRPDENLEKVTHVNLNSKTLLKPNIKSKNNTNQHISKNQLLAISKPELIKLNNKEKKNEFNHKNELNFKEELSKNNSKKALDPLELNKPVSNNFATDNNYLLTNETDSKYRDKSVFKSENNKNDNLEKKSKDNITRLNESEKNEFGGLSKLKAENINDIIFKSKIEDTSVEKAKERDIYEVNSLKKLNKVNFLTNFLFTNKPSDYSLPELVKPLESKPNYIPKKGISLRLGYSPDISLIKGHSAEKIGNNFNALLEWRISSRWAISSGVIKSLKYYDAYPNEYNWPANWKKPPNPLLEINATCNMLDIPINIRYDLKSFKNGLFFIKSGLTSYMMLKEKYVYDYENNNDPMIKWKSWEGSTGNYRLGVINLSTGIELKYKKNIFIQIEPFAKIPIKEIGFGKVMLSTYGVFVSTKIPLVNFK